MIRPIDIRLNAAHPELPLVEAVTFIGSPSTVLIRGVPKAVGNWSITAVNVAVTYPDNSTTTRAAVESAEGVWVATIPGTATSGRTAAGFKIMADGIDENGAAVTGYVLGFADFAVLSFTPVPAPGGTFWLLRYFDTMPTTPKKGDVAIVGGILKYYNGAAWLPFADLTNYYTKAETDNAIERVAAYYITYNAAGAAFPTRADLINAQTYYSGGVARVPTRNDYAVVLADEAHGGAEYRYIYAVPDGATTGQWEAQYPIETNDYVALSNKPQINNVTLTGVSSQSGDSLGLVDKTDDQTIGGDKRFTGYDYFYDLTVSHPQGMGYIRIYALVNENRVHIDFSDAVSGSHGELFLPVLVGYNTVTLAAIENLAPDASLLLHDGATVDLNTLCCYQGRLYRCILGYTFQSGDSYPPDDTTHWTLATVEDVLAALRAALAGKADVSAIPYSLGTPIVIDTASSEVVSGETVYYGAATLADRTANIVGVAVALDELRVTIPPAVSGKVRDFGLYVAVGVGEGTALAAPALVPIAPTGETITIMNAEGEMPTLADGTTTASGTTVLYFTEVADSTFLVKGEQIQEVA